MTAEPNRREVVEAIFNALVDMDPSRLASIATLGVTPAEKAEADGLFLATLQARVEHDSRVGVMWDRLLTRRYDEPPTWEQLFDDLPDGGQQGLLELYDVLPDGARQEYDARYGRPEL